MTKASGKIPAGYAADGAVLRVAGRPVDTVVAEAGATPVFIYDLNNVAQHVREFRNNFPGIHLHYAIKANAYKPLLSFIAKLVDGLDIASEGELKLALEAGADPAAISFAGPGKRAPEIAAAIAAGITLNAESEGEVERALAIAAECGIPARLAVRVNPPFEIRGSGMRMGGGPRPFGVDSDRVPKLVRRILDAGADWRGLHIFAGSQALNPDAIIEAQRATLDLAAELSQAAGRVPPLVNIGGGFGIPYFAGEQPLDIAPIGRSLTRALAHRPPIFAGTQFAIELGRWLVGEAGIYLTRIVDKKVSHGKTFLVTDGGMHHQLAASGNFGQVVRRNYPVAIANRMDAPADEEVSIVGCLCTPLDRIADDVMLPRAEVGDLVAVFMSGAYGLSASPQAFLAQKPALERVVGGD